MNMVCVLDAVVVPQKACVWEFALGSSLSAGANACWAKLVLKINSGGLMETGRLQ